MIHLKGVFQGLGAGVLAVIVQRRRSQYAATGDNLYAYGEFDESGERRGDYGLSGGQQRGREWDDGFYSRL